MKKEILILKTMQEMGLPVGASFLSEKLSMAPATVGRLLTTLDRDGLIAKVSNKGRILTEEGIAFLAREENKNARQESANDLARLVSETDPSTLLEILQVRRLLEGYAVQKACSHASEEDILELEGLVLEHLHEIRCGRLGSDVDLNIHLTIARISGCRTIYQILKIILMDDNVYTRFSLVSDQLKHAQIKQHGEIVKAIQEKDPERAEKAMEHHLSQIIEDVKQYYARPDN